MFDAGLDVIEWWILLSMVMIVAEMFILPGLGLLFVGLGGMTLAGLMALFPAVQEFQYIIAALLSCLWFVLLWRPLKKYVYDQTEYDPVLDLVGSVVQVYGNDIIPGMLGQVMWSGTVMNAKLNHDIYQAVKVGSQLQVVEVRGNILICSLVNPLKVSRDPSK